MLDWFAISYSRGSSYPGIEPTSQTSPALAGGFFPSRTTWEAQELLWLNSKKTRNTHNLKMDQVNRRLSKEDIWMKKWCMKTCSESLVIREVQVNTMMRHHFTPVRKALIKRNPKTKDKCRQEYGNVGILVHCWWECILVQSLWKTVWKFLKILKIELAYDLPIHFLVYIQRNWNQDLKEISVLWCSLQLCALWPSYGKKKSVYLWMNK